jgi:putative acetyltransferase
MPDRRVRTQRAELPLALRPARRADAAGLLSVHTRAIRALAASHYSEAQRDAWIARMSSERLQEAMSARQLVVAEVATPEGPRIVGYGQLHPVEGAIEAIYVDPDFSRRGVGRTLCDALQERARVLGLPGLVLDASLNSVPFYAAMGFRQRCVDHHELAPGVQMAFAVMEKRFAPVARDPRRGR